MIDEKKLIEKLGKQIVTITTPDDPEIRTKYWNAGISYALNCIEKQPKIGEWIPCSERLPNDIAIHEVTAQFSNGTIYTEFAYYDESRAEWWKFDDDGMVNVIAWKEHSEPYKEEVTE